jgi:hypothetical protein
MSDKTLQPSREDSAVIPHCASGNTGTARRLLRGIVVLSCVFSLALSAKGQDAPAGSPGPAEAAPAADQAPSAGEAAAAPALPDSLQADIKTVIPAGIFYGSFTKEDGPYLLDGSVTVPSGQTLEFGPGSVVYIGGSYSTITIFGQIVARGTREEPVMFLSARKRPNPWDWDRIYVRSKNRSLFEHCVVRHSNYGITVENGSASISNCRFERNSLYAVAVKNSEVSVAATAITGGQVLGMLLSAGASVIGDSLTITDNTTAIGCDGKATLSLRSGSISGNVNGLVLTPDASVAIVGTEISHNKSGIITEKSIPKKSRQMVYANGTDEKIVSAAEVRKYLKEPETVRSIVLPKTAAAIAAQKGFAAGFSAMSQQEEATSSFIGNVTAGFRYFSPTTNKHPVQDTIFPQTLYADGLQPEIQVFASGKRGNTDVNLLMDVYANQWLSTEGYMGKNMLNLGLTYDNHTLSFGDFFESGSETSLSGRQMTGIKYTGYYWDMGGGLKRMEYKLAAGESEVPKDSGHHDLNQYNVKVDSGMSMRQQITYIMGTTLRPTRASTFTAQGIIARDQVDQPLFRASLTDPGAPRPIEAQTGVLAGTMALLNGGMELFAEIDLGTHDTIDSNDAGKVAWYNPEIEEAVPKIFRNFTSKSKFSNHYAAVVGGRGLYKGYDIDLSYTEIGPHYFSAGNPYLEINRRIGKLQTERQFKETVSAAATYEYEQARASGTPTDRNTLNIKGDYAMGENLPAFSVNLTERLETNTSTERYVIVTADTTDNDSAVYTAYDYQKLTTIGGIEGKQNLSNGLSYSCTYQVLFDNDLSEHANVANNDLYDRMQHQVSGWMTFKLKKLLRNKFNFRVTFKNENRDSLNSVAYKISDQFSVTVIPRKLTFTVAGEMARKTEKEYAVDTLRAINLGWQDPVLTNFTGGELEAKYTITPRLSASIKGRYEQSYDDVESSRENYNVIIAGMNVTWLF